MITKYSELYQALFEKANKRLYDLGIVADEQNTTIQDLEHYFQNLDYLVNGDGSRELTDKERLEGYLFLKLPLDEPAFTIDANTRVITVPDNFKKNGLSVVGDQIAEIVFFEIDRFYDATDLSLTKITIEWKSGPDNKGRTAAFIRDIESKGEENKLIFGWPITKEITERAGKIEFSVRFYRTDADKKLIYSFSTLPQTITINNSLNLSTKEVLPDDAAPLILGRVLNSLPGGTSANAATPYFVYWNPETMNINEQINGSLILAVLGQKKDGGSLTYKWFFNEEERTNGYQTVWDKDEEGKERGAYIEVTEMIVDTFIYYYYHEEDKEYKKIECYNQSEFKENLEKYNKLFIRCSIYELTEETVKAGTYSVDLCNTYYTDTTSAVERKAWTVAGADDPTVTLDTKGKLIDNDPLTFTALDTIGNSVSYIWNKEDANGNITQVGNEAEYIPTEEGLYSVTVTNTKNNDSKSNTSNWALCVNEIEDFSENNLSIVSNLGSLTVQVERDIKPFETRTYAWYLDNAQEPFEFSSTCKATTGHSYTVKVTISKGNVTSKSATLTYSEN